MNQYERNRARYLCVPGGSVRFAPVACTLEERRATVGCYLVEDDGHVWCVYNRCQHGYAEVTCLYSPMMDIYDEPATARTVPVGIEV